MRSALTLATASLFSFFLMQEAFLSGGAAGGRGQITLLCRFTKCLRTIGVFLSTGCGLFLLFKASPALQGALWAKGRNYPFWPHIFILAYPSPIVKYPPLFFLFNQKTAISAVFCENVDPPGIEPGLPPCHGGVIPVYYGPV